MTYLQKNLNSRIKTHDKTLKTCKIRHISAKLHLSEGLIFFGKIKYHAGEEAFCPFQTGEDL